MDSLENWLYPIPDLPKRTRTKPMKILALGMSRSGTESLRRALQILGYDHVYHGFDIIETSPMAWKAWTLLGRRKYGKVGTADGCSEIGREDFDALLGHCEAVTDQPCALFASELIQAYPEAKVILNRRDVDAWYRSVCDSFLNAHSTVRSYILIWFDPELYWNARYGADVFLSFFHQNVRQHAKWVYEDHSAKIRSHAPPERLLEWTIGDGWEPLCRFLDKPIPSQGFPSGNSSAALMERYNKGFETSISTAKRNLSVFLIVIGVLVAYAVQRSLVFGM